MSKFTKTLKPKLRILRHTISEWFGSGGRRNHPKLLKVHYKVGSFLHAATLYKINHGSNRHLQADAKKPCFRFNSGIGILLRGAPLSTRVRFAQTGLQVGLNKHGDLYTAQGARIHRRPFRTANNDRKMLTIHSHSVSLPALKKLE